MSTNVIHSRVADPPVAGRRAFLAPIVLALSSGAGEIQVPYDSILGWRVPEGHRVGRTLRHSLLGGIAGAMVGASVGFDGATITRSALESVEGVSALDAIRRLRPQFLRARRAGLGREALKLASMLEIQYFSPAEASMWWGLGHAGGVITVMSRRA